MDKKLSIFCAKFLKENRMKYNNDSALFNACTQAWKHHKENQQSDARGTEECCKKDSSEWIKFCKKYADAKGCKYHDALKLGGADFKKYKEMKGAGLVDTINDFLSKFVAGPIGDAIKNAMVKRFKGV